MTKKDYIELARIISKNRLQMVGGHRATTHVISREFIIELCAYLEKDNPNFNEAKFRKASGEVNNNR